SWDGSAPLRLSNVQWQRCDPAGTACTTIATATKYTVQPGDAGFSFRLIATVTNGVGSTTVGSQLSLPVGGSSAPAPVAPQNLAPPKSGGAAQEGGKPH